MLLASNNQNFEESSSSEECGSHEDSDDVQEKIRKRKAMKMMRV